MFIFVSALPWPHQRHSGKGKNNCLINCSCSSWVACNFFFIFPYIFVSWRLITLQYCSGFCHILTWISHGITCVPHPDPPSCLPLHPIRQGLPSAPALSNFYIGKKYTPLLYDKSLWKYIQCLFNKILVSVHCMPVDTSLYMGTQQGIGYGPCSLGVANPLMKKEFIYVSR